MTKYHTRIILTGTIFLLLSCFHVEISKAREQKEITVVFRFDDPSATSCTEIEEKLITAFRRHNMRCTFGVIPFVSQELLPLTPIKVRMLHQAVQEGVLEIALHGYSHQNNGLRKGVSSEFAGLDYEEQLRRIKQGRQFLEEKLLTPVAVFIPPWNSYDSNTVKALEQLEFQCLSADLFGFAGLSNSLEYLPITCGPWNIKDTIEAARKTPDPAPCVAMLFHEFNFKEVNNQKGKITYDYFLDMLAWLSVQKDVNVKSVGQVRNKGTERYLENQKIARAIRFLPEQFRYKLSPVIFFSSAEVRNARVRCCTLISVFYATVLLISGILSFLLGSILFSRARVVSNLCLPLGIVLLLGGSIYTFHDLSFCWKGIVGIVAVFGYCVGICGANLRHKRQVSRRKSTDF